MSITDIATPGRVVLDDEVDTSTRDGRKLSAPWQLRHVPSPAAPPALLYRPPCGSTWHETHDGSTPASLTFPFPNEASVAAGHAGSPGRVAPWHAAQVMVACFPSSARRSVACASRL